MSVRVRPRPRKILQEQFAIIPSDAEIREACRVFDLIRLEPGAVADPNHPQAHALRAARASANRLIAAMRGNSDERRIDAVKAAEQLPKRRGCAGCGQRLSLAEMADDRLCITCNELHARKARQSANLTGYRAVVTGARIGLGYEVALKLLRAGAAVEATSRFPCSAARRFAEQSDSESWSHRIRLHGLDFRDSLGVEALARQLGEAGPVEILINNAAQTVHRPRTYYARELAIEGRGREALPPVFRDAIVPTNQVLALSDRGTCESMIDAVDRRVANSWTSRIGGVVTEELAEVCAVNAMAPFVLLNHLLPAMRHSPKSRRFVVNVSAKEGRFGVAGKQAAHPHTNMAKAALNMLTLTCAAELADENIFVTAVDPGWMSDQRPAPDGEPAATPLDFADGAARVLDPILAGISEDARPAFGVLLKDYRVAEW